MIYTFLSAVFITLFLVIGTLSIYGFYELWLVKHYPLKWACYQHVFVLMIVAVLSFILAVVFGLQIPQNYV